MYGDFDNGLGPRHDSKIGMNENFQQRARVGLGRVNDTPSGGVPAAPMQKSSRRIEDRMSVVGNAKSQH